MKTSTSRLFPTQTVCHRCRLLCFAALAMVLAVQTANAFTNPVQRVVLTASNPDLLDLFGRRAVALSGNTMVVGASSEDSNATGVNGNQNDNSASAAGAAYVFVYDGTNWFQQAYLKASNSSSNDVFGTAVAISGDTIVIGAPQEDSNATGVGGDQSNNSATNAGAAYVFVRAGTNWAQQAYLKASNSSTNDAFGTSVAISGDTVVIGATGEDSNATGVNGNQSNNSTANSGAAYVFIRTGTVWTQQAYLKPSNTSFSWVFGSAVAAHGDTVVVGAQGEGNSATGINGNQNLGSASGSGAAYVFTRSSTVWTQQAYIKASNTDAGDFFGGNVALENNLLVVGAHAERSLSTGVNGNDADDSGVNCGAAYVFTRSGNTWSQQAYLKGNTTASGDLFGTAVAVHGEMIAIGAPGQSQSQGGINGGGQSGSGDDSGTVYIFSRTNSTWSQSFYAKASPPVTGGDLGVAVALSSEHVAAAAGTTVPFGDSIGVVYIFGEALPEPPATTSRVVSIGVDYDPVFQTQTVTLNCTGQPGVSYGIMRSDQLTNPLGSWEELGLESALPDGTFTFVDFAPLPDGGFYILRRQP